MLTRRTLKSRLLAGVAAGCLCLVASGSAPASDCGCHACQTFPSTDCCESCCVPCDCSCPVCKIGKHNCLSKAFDAMKGRLHGFLDPTSCGCDESLCDDGCDASMMGDLMMPIPPAGHHHHHPHHVTPMHQAPMPIQPYQGPTRDIQLTPTGPSQFEAAGRGNMPLEFEHESGQHLGGRSQTGNQGEAEVPPPIRPEDIESPIAPQPDLNMDRESLFDSDPFRDDQTRRPVYRPVRPSSYDRNMRPIRKLPLSRSRQTSSRRTGQARW